MDADAYDEFGLFYENAQEWNLPFDGPPHVVRVAIGLDDGRTISGLRWGANTPHLVLLHGGAQNAHTYDTLALALGVDLIALDLPGHGHSDGGRDGVLSPASMAEDVIVAISELCDGPITLVGMSLGGMVAMHVATQAPELIARVGFVDITPGVNQEKAQHITAFINGPQGFESFEDLLARTMEHNPTRDVKSLRRGILHNAVQLDDGTWIWRWARHRSGPMDVPSRPSDLWGLLASIKQPALLIRGMSPGSVVDDDDEATFLATAQNGAVRRVERAGHSVQGDQPLVLAEILTEFLTR